ncbi:MAG: PD-(D/E)XK nuclease family protein [Myxococcales bacterium]
MKRSVGLFESPCGEQRLAAAEAFLRDLPAQEPALILAPSPLSGLALVQRVLGPGQARAGWAKHTLESAALEFALPSLARAGLALLRGVGVEALCARVVFELSGTGELGRFGEIGQRPGFVRALSEALIELRMAGVTTALLAPHDRELALFLQRYEEALEREQLCDRPRLFALASEALGADPRRALARCALVVLDVPLVHARESEFAAALCRARLQARVSVARGDEHSEHFWRLSLGEDALTERRFPLEDHDLAQLKRQLFAPSLSGSGPAAERGRVKLMSGAGENREAVEVAREILAAAERGVAFDRMAIFLRAADAYRDPVEEALRRAQIPAHFADGVRRPVPEGRAFLALLACAREGLSARAFAEYLSLGVAPAAVDEQPDDTRTGAAVDDDSERTPRSPRRWERLLVDATVIGGRARWERRLRSLLCELDLELVGTEPEGPRHASLTLQRGQLAALLEFALPLLDRLTGLPQRASWGEWLAALDDLARRSLQRPESVREALLELAPLASVGPVELLDVERLLSRRLGTAIVRSGGHGAGKVFVGDVEDAAGRSFEQVFVLGLAEKVFPPRLHEDPILPDAKRRALGPHLMLTEERAARERVLLRLAVGAARGQVVLSFPRFDVEHGRPRVPSFYGLEVLHAVDGALPAFDELNRRADPGAAARMGWPAPASPEQAIDDAEYDLAVLDLWRARAGARKGGARYSLLANPNLARALRFRARRWETPRFTQADGLVLSQESAARLMASERLAARPYSASALAQFASCPYRFFLHSVMGVAEREQVPELDELDARQRGVLFHAVQHDVLSGLAAEQLLPLTREGLTRARALLEQVFVAQVASLKETYAPAVERVFDASLVALRADLEEWLARMLDEARWIPWRFELGFGLRSSLERDPHSRVEPVLLPVGLKLRGAINLVERSAGSDSAAPTLVRATDHKTGKAQENALAVTDGGRVLQPLLYALALEQLFPSSKVDAGRLYFCTSKAGFQSHDVPLNDGNRKRAQELVNAIDGMVAQGFLPAAPQHRAGSSECDHCAYRVVCGPYEAERVARVKAQDGLRLSPLHRVRGMP